MTPKDTKDKPWLVTMTGQKDDSDTYGPLSQQAAIDLRDQLKVAAGPGYTIEAWMAESPDPRVVKDPAEAWLRVAA